MTRDKIIPAKINNNGFQIFHGAASRIGESHINFPIGYQDAQFCLNHGGVFVGVICDGCSLATNGYTQNQVGAILGSELIARNLFKYANYSTKGNVNFNYILSKSNRESRLFFKRFLGSLRASQLRIDRKKFIEEKLLFTVIGLLVINNLYCFFGCGDGLFGINHDVCDVEKDFSSQKYLQPLLDSKVAEKFIVYRTGIIKDDVTLWIASDGLLGLFNKEEGLENFSKFLSDERTCKIIEDDDQTIQPFRQLTQKYKSRLNDDITVVISKVKSVSEDRTRHEVIPSQPM
jgi:hypothetical protein